MHLGALIRPGLIFVELPGSDRSTVLKALADSLAAREILSDPEGLYERLLEREELGSTGIGGGVAIPHCKVKGLDEVVVAIGTTQRAIEYAAEDGQPVRLFFLVISPEDEPAAHLQVLSAISRWVKDKEGVEKILEQEDSDQIYQLLRGEET